MNLEDKQKAMTMLPPQVAHVIRFTFTRQGAMAYIGHLDLMRTFERALRRAHQPVLYSQGYNPRPMMVFALPLGVGIATVSDYLDVSFAEPLAPDEVIKAVNSYLPQDVFLTHAHVVDASGSSLMSLVSAAAYDLIAPNIVEPALFLLERDEIIVEKQSKGKPLLVDIRPLILDIRPIASQASGLESPESATTEGIQLLVCAGSSRNVRPDLFLSALTLYQNYPPSLAANCQVRRKDLYQGEYPQLVSLGEA